MTDHLAMVRRDRLNVARDWLASGGSVLFFGPPDAGKSAALDVLVAAARACRVLQCHAARPDAVAPYGCLARLLSSITWRELEGLGTAQRDLLAEVLAHQVAAVPAAVNSVRRAALDLVRTLSGTQPLMLSIDDTQRLDAPSAEVLRFIATRVEDLPVRLAVAECVTGDLLPKARSLCPMPLLAVRLAPLTTAAGPDRYDYRRALGGRCRAVPWHWRHHDGTF